jgi:hypothetical protein
MPPKTGHKPDASKPPAEDTSAVSQAVMGSNDGTQGVQPGPRSASNETPPQPGSYGPEFPRNASVPQPEESGDEG